MSEPSHLDLRRAFEDNGQAEPLDGSEFSSGRRESSFLRHHQKVRSPAFDEESIGIEEQDLIDPRVRDLRACDVIGVDGDVFRVAALLWAGMSCLGLCGTPDVGLGADGTGRRDEFRRGAFCLRPFDANDAVASAESCDRRFDEELLDIAQVRKGESEAVRVAAQSARMALGAFDTTARYASGRVRTNAGRITGPRSGYTQPWSGRYRSGVVDRS